MNGPGSRAGASAPGLAPQPLGPRPTAAGQVHGLMREAILTCRLAPGEAVSESRICGLYGVSRSPVRIALTRLVEDGLVDVYPQRGSFVAPIRLRDVRDSQFARIALESALAEAAAKVWSATHAAAAAGGLARQARHAAAGETAEFYLENEAFHRLIASAAGLDGVWRTVQGIKMLWDRIGHIANRMPGHMQAIVTEHAAIAEALGRGDPGAAAEAMRRHLGSVHVTIAGLRPLFPDYFTET